MRHRLTSIVLALALIMPALVVLTAVPASATTFSNPSGVTLNDPNSQSNGQNNATATPYPSTIAVSGLSGTINNVAVTLNAVSYSHSQDLDVLLVGPGGQSLIVVANLGPNGGAAAPASNSTLTVSDSGTLPTMLTPWGSSSTIKAVNFGGFNEVWESPAPAGPYGDPGTNGTGATLASVFNGTNPNGTWSLYVITTAGGDGTGAISGGWSLAVTTAAAAPTTTTVSSGNNPSFTSAPGNSVTLTATVHRASDSSNVSEGTVNFTDGGVAISGCGAVAVSAGQATCTTSLSTEGGHPIGAQYSGDANLGASGATLTQQVNDHTTVTGASFCNTGSLTLSNPSSTTANASPYPSDVFVSGLAGAVSQVAITLNGATYSHSQDIDALLVGPAGQSFILVTAAGPDTNGAISNVTLTLDDAAAGTIAAGSPWGAPNATVTSKPVNYGGVNENWGPPAPGGPYGNPGPSAGGSATLGSVFNGTNPNGTWNLYVVTTAAGDGTGAIAGGWCANITTASVAATTTAIASNNNPSFTAAPGNSVTFTATVHKASDNSNVGEGTVNFTNGGVTISGCGAQAVSAGQATCTTNFSTEGAQAIDAQYRGDANFGASSATLTQQVNDHTSVTGNNFCNTGGIALNNPTISNPAAGASPYPSDIFVSGRPGNLQHLAVTLNGATYSHSQDIDALLVGPGGQSFIVVAAAGPDSGGAIDNVTLTLDDNAASTIAANAAWGASNAAVTTKAVNYGGDNETFGLPAPAGPYGNPGPAGGGSATLGGTFDAMSPNGTWSLYAITTAGGDGTGAIAGGWCLNITSPAPPVLTKAFVAASVPLNGTTTLTFTVSNPNATSSLTGVGFTDTLPAGLVVSTPNALTSTCGGTIAATAGSGNLSLSGASLAAGASCSFSVKVTATSAGAQVNTTSVVSSIEGGNGTPATATLLVVAPPVLAKAFGATSIVRNGSTSLTFTVNNQNATSSLSGIGFTDTLPAGVVISTPNGLANGCGGTVTATAGSGKVILAGATLASGSNCAVTVNVTGTTAGTKVNTTSVVASVEGGNGAAATATLHVTSGPPQIAKSFGAATVPVNGSTSLSFTITNPAGNGTSTGIGFNDTLPVGLVVSIANGVSGTCPSGTISAVAASPTVSLSGAALAAGASCTFSVSVTGTTPGVKNNSVMVSSSNGGPGNTATATVTVVAPPTLAKSFAPTAIALNGSSTLSFTVSNPNATSSLSVIGFTDTLPVGLVVATPSAVTGTCGGGSITAAAASGSVSLSGTTLAAMASCTFSVKVTGTSAGAKVNTTSVIGSQEGGNGAPATATLNVLSPPVIAKAFGAPNVALNGTTSLSFTITNPPANAVSLTGVGFTDLLPAGLIVASPNGLTGSCGGGAITAAPGSGSVGLSGAVLSTSSSCTFSVNVTGTAAGVKSNTVTVSSTNGGTGNTASATLAVALPPQIAKSFGAPTIPVNGSTSLSFTVTNPAANTTFGLTGVGFTDTLPAGLVVATPNGLTGACGGGSVGAPAASPTVSLSGAALAGGASCTFSVQVKGTTAGVKNNSVTVSSANAGPGNTATASVTVVAPPTIAKSFGAATLVFGASTTLSFTVANPNATVPLTTVGFTDALPAGLVVATPNGITGSCGGGTVAAAAGSSGVTLSGAMLPGGAGCTFSVKVTAVGGGVQHNVTSAVTSANGGTGLTASASLTVTRAPTTTTVTASPSNATFATPVTFTATVAPSGPNASGTSPSGTVSFFLDGGAVPVITLVLTSSGMFNTAAFTTSGLGAGSHTVSASYSGDANFLASSSAAPATVTVSGTTATITGNHTGSVVVGAGMATLIVNAALNGSIVVQSGGSLDVEASSVTGAITADKGSSVRICGSSLSSVNVSHATGFVLIGDAMDGCATNTLSGSLMVLNNTGGVQVIGNHVAGTVTASGNSGAGPFPDDTAPNISGNGH